MFIKLNTQQDNEIIYNVNQLKFFRKREFVKNGISSPAEMRYLIDFVLTDTVITETFSERQERDEYYENIKQQLHVK